MLTKGRSQFYALEQGTELIKIGCWTTVSGEEGQTVILQDKLRVAERDDLLHLRGVLVPALD